MDTYKINMSNLHKFIRNELPSLNGGLESYYEAGGIIRYGGSQLVVTARGANRLRVFDALLEACRETGISPSDYERNREPEVPANIISFTEAFRKRSDGAGNRNDLMPSGNKYMGMTAHERARHVASERADANKSIIRSLTNNRSGRE